MTQPGPERFVCGLALLVGAALPWALPSTYYLHIAILTIWFAYLATAWNIVGGYAGQPSFGHALFVGSGGYTSALLFIHLGLSPWIGMWVGGVIAGLFGVLLGFLSFRYGVRGHFFLLATIAFAQLFYIIVINTSALGGAAGFTIPLLGHDPLMFQFAGKIYFYYIVFAMLVGIGVLSIVLKNGRLGYYWIAIRDNESSAAAIGIDIMRYKMIALVLSSFLSGVGGAFYAQYMVFIEPEGLFGIGLSAEIVVYTIVGGVGTPLGAAVGALLLYPLAEVFRATLGGNVPGVHLIAYGLVLIGVIVYLPEGVAGLWRRLVGAAESGGGPSPDDPTGDADTPASPPPAGRPTS